MFMAAIFTNVKRWKQPSVKNEWINKWWLVYTYNEITFSHKELENITIKISHSQKQQKSYNT